MIKRARMTIPSLLAAVVLLCGCAKQCGPRAGSPNEGKGSSAREKRQVELPAGATQKGLGNASRFGIDYVFPLQDKDRQRRWPVLLSATGAGWINFANVAWEKLEPRAPSGGRHQYHWSELDEAVRRYQEHGFRLTFSLRMGNGWFAGPIRHRPAVGGALVKIYVKNSDRLPAAEHAAAYGAWIRALVERYDGDGRRDMPGLRSAVLHYQIGNEYSNPMFSSACPTTGTAASPLWPAPTPSSA